ncbi:MAG: alpha/beta fold hydrolase [bacterium]|nr:alpha/beta fold hydrolase [bacterium]
MSNIPLLLLPGLLNDARLWEAQISGLADIADITVADSTRENSMAALASAALAQAPAQHFALAGLSMGGYVALEIMRQAPERVTGLALLDTSARPDTAEATQNRRKLIKLAGNSFPAVVNGLLPKMVHPAHLQDAELTGIFRAMALTVGQAAFVRQQEAIIGRIDSRPFLKNIKCPTLVLCGRDDAITPVSLHEEMVAGIPASRLVIIEECGHLSVLEQPQQVNDAFEEWLHCINA